MSEILFLAHRIPYPPDRGDKIRSWHLLKHLAAQGRVHLACFADDDADAAHLGALRQSLGTAMGRSHVEVRTVSRAAAAARAFLSRKPISLTLFDHPRLRSFVEMILARPDVRTVFAFSGQMAQFVPVACRQRFVMDFVDMDSAKFGQYASEAAGPMRWVNAREERRLFDFERRVGARADVSLFVSEAEAALFRGRTGLSNVHALSNGIDLDYFRPAPMAHGEDRQLLFTGQMDYRPNIDAVQWFAREVLPHVPGRFVIAGRSPTSEVRALESDRVTVTGAVPDMRSWLAAADVVVAPLRVARGIQNKVLEAMAMAKPVIASSAAFEGIEAEPGRDLVVADGAAAMAEAIRSLFDDAPRAAQLGANARNLVESSYSWSQRLSPLARIVQPAATP